MMMDLSNFKPTTVPFEIWGVKLRTQAKVIIKKRSDQPIVTNKTKMDNTAIVLFYADKAASLE